MARHARTVDVHGYLTLHRHRRLYAETGVSSVGMLRRVQSHTLFETKNMPPRLRLFGLGQVLGEEGWIEFLKLEEYGSRRSHRPDESQQVQFPYPEAI